MITVQSPQVLRPKQYATQRKDVSIPYNFSPRVYQEQDVFRQLFPHHYPDLRLLGTPRRKRICLLWHRRAGKDKSLVNAIALAAFEEVGNYLYLLPQQNQAKKVIWRGIDGSGFRFRDHFHPSIVQKIYESELLIELKNGSTVQFGGTDNYDAWMGTNPVGIIFSEYSLQDPMAWQYFRPILVENGGWAVFNYTARGKNHGYDLYHNALRNPKEWYASLKTIEDTQREDGTPVVSVDQYLQEIAEGMPEPVARQEFYCDFEAALFGSYYGDLMTKAYAEGRIGFFPADPALPVYTAWDIGLDATAVWFAQAVNGHPVLVDYIENVNTKFTESCQEVLAKPYIYAEHFGPHDIVNRNPEMETRKQTAANLGIDFVVTPRQAVADGIEAVRNLLPRCRFDDTNAERGVDMLKSYERQYNDKLQRFMDNPLHNYASHGADAFRILALNWTDSMGDESWFNKNLAVKTETY